MRKIYAFLFAVIIAATAIFRGPLPVYGSDVLSGDFKINVNGSRLYVDVAPVTKNSRMFVPLRGVIERLGYTPEWDEENQIITITYKDIKIVMKIGDKLMFVNGTEKYMDVAPFLHNGRTLVPLRFVAENMNMWVDWVPEANLAALTEPDYFDRLPATTVLGYTTNDYKGDNASYNSLISNDENINTVATFSHTVGPKGELMSSGESQANTVSFALSKGLKPLMLVHNFKNGGFDIDLAHSVLSNEQNRKNLVNNILVAVSKEGYAGVNIDIEHIYWYDRPFYSAFIKELKEKLTPYGFLTTTAVMAKTYDSYQNNNWSGAFDYKEIGKYADQVVLMTYDEHYFGGPAGPVASYPWVEDVLKYAVSVIPSKKVLMGVPGYGYDWASTGTRAIAMKNIENLAYSSGVTPQWNDYYKSPYFIYYKNGVKHEVWYENAASISSKLDLVDKYKLGGIGLWRLGYDNNQFWDVVREKLNYR